jgi:outer membrane lipoprotein-sorting protein
MRKILILIFTLARFTVAQSQEDPEAMRILDRFSSVGKGAPSVSIDFSMVTTDAIENRKDTMEGSVVIAGDRYKLSLPESITWFNGTDHWNYMPSVKEVVITRPDTSDLSFFSKPSLLFEMHRQEYRGRLIEETASSYIVDLYPDDPKSEMVRVRLTITKAGSELKSAEYRAKNGITVLINVRDYNLKLRPDNKFFIFNTSDYKGVEVIDMR